MKSCRLIAGLLCLGSLALPAKAAGETTMMELAGDLMVNRYGEAVYNIPLETPPGPGQLSPELALVYSSQTAHGLLSHGWQLSGLSSIHRCVSIPALHGRRQGLSFSESDSLCLDGQFLKPLSQLSAGSREYRSQPDQFVRIRTNDPQSPTHFLARTKPGLILEFGGSQQAWIEYPDHHGNRRILAWLLSRMWDRSGNRIDFHYRRADSGETLIDHIAYGPNQIRFHYRKKNRPLKAFVAGVPVPQAHLLKRVDMHINQTVVRSYHFSYNREEQLQAVSGCARQDCLEPTRFVWRERPLWSLREWGEGLHSQNQGRSHQRYRSGDFNGDGLGDFYEVPGVGERQAAVHINQGDGSFLQHDGPWHQVDMNDDLSHFFAADFDGDGLSDIYHFRHNHDNDIIYLAREEEGRMRFTPVSGVRRDQHSRRPALLKKRCLHSGCFRLADFNGDGRSDIYHIRLANDADAIYLSDGSGNYNKIAGIVSDDGQGSAAIQINRLRFADFNGDGRGDIYFIKPKGRDLVFLNLRDGHYQAVSGINTDLNLAADHGRGLLRIRLGDFNGDGLSDVYYASHRDEPDLIHLSHGDGRYTQLSGPLIQRPRSGEALSLALQGMKFADLNGDGKTDLYLVADRHGKPDRVYLAQSDGSLAAGVASLVTAISGSYERQSKRIARLAFVDINGDGAADLMDLPADDGRLAKAYTAVWQGHLLKEINTGLGGSHRINYRPLVQVLQDRRVAREAYPIVRTPLAIHVVSGIHHGGGSDDASESYDYGGPRLSLAGEGFLGFDWLQQRSRKGMLAERSHYRLDFPYQGLLVSRQEKIMSSADQEWDAGQLRESSSYSYESALSDQQLRFPVLRQVSHSRYDNHGSLLVETAVYYRDYDAYGNASEVETLTSGNGETFSEQLSSTYRNDEERWIVGRPEMVQTRYRDGRHDDVVRQVRFDYHEDSGLLLSKTVEPDHPLGHREEYYYDRYGNTVRTVSSDLNGDAQRVRQSHYDNWGRFPVRTVNALGHTEHHQYDELLIRPVKVVNASGHVGSRHYDNWGRLLMEKRADGSEVIIHYLSALPDDSPPHSAYALRTESLGHPARTTYYDHNHRSVREEWPGFDGRLVRRDRVYDALGQRIRESFPYYYDEQPQWTDFNYDVAGRLLKKAWPADDQLYAESFAYYGLNVAHVNESGLIRWLRHDALDRVIQIDEPLDAMLRFEYDAAGRLLSMVDTEDNRIVMQYDVFGNLVHTRDANRGERHFVYNAWGEMIAERDAHGHHFQQSYDALGRLRERRAPGELAAWVYDDKPNAIGKLVRISRNHISREFNYDAHGRLASTLDHRGYAFMWHYDHASRLARVTQPGEFAVERLYNRHGYLSAVRSPAVPVKPQMAEWADQLDVWRSQAEFYRQLADGLRDSSGSHHQSLNQAAHDLSQGAEYLASLIKAPPSPFARVLQCLQRSQRTITQADNLLSRAERAEAAAAFVYRQQVAHRIRQNDECLQSAQSLNLDDREVFYHWRALRRDASGRVELEQLGNDWRTERVFDPASGRPLSIRSLHHGLERRDWRYSYDQRGNLIWRRDAMAGVSQWFDYDDLDRLVSVNTHNDQDAVGARRVLYHYDSQGNLQFDSEVGSYLYGGNQLAPHAVSSLGHGNTYRYDRKGRLLENRQLKVRWLDFDKPEIISDKLNNQWLRFDYDAEQKLSGRASSDGHQLDYAGKTYRRLRQRGQIQEECHTIYAESRAIADFCRQRQDEGWRLFYYHHDALGSVDTLSDWSGAALSRAHYSAFGQCQDKCLPGVAGLSRGFGGHEYLQELNLLNMNGRIYDPLSKQFLSPDAYQAPLHFTQAYNPYRYGLNNPFRYADPSGYFIKSLVRRIKNVVKGALRFVQRNARPLAAAFVGYQLGSLAGHYFLKQATSQLVWSPGAMASGSYMAAYGEAVASSSLLAGAVAGSSSSLLAGGGLRATLVNTLSGGAFARLGVVYQGQWTPGRVLAGSLISGSASALQGGDFTKGALAYLQGGALKSVALAMRRAMIAQSSLNARNLGASSAGFMGDGIKLGGGRFNPSATAALPSPLGGHQGQSGLLFGHPYAPGSWQDLLIEAYAGPHDYLNSFYWYDSFGNIRPGINTAGRFFGEALNYTNVALATPLVAASVVPDYFYALTPR